MCDCNNSYNWDWSTVEVAGKDGIDTDIVYRCDKCRTIYLMAIDPENPDDFYKKYLLGELE